MLDPVVLAYAVPAVLFAGISKGGFANGPSFAATPILALAMPPAEAAALMLPMLMVMDATAVRAWWRRWDGPVARRMILGTLPGIALGALVFGSLPPGPVQLTVGALALGFVAYRLAQGQGWLKPGQPLRRAPSAALWGGITGFTSTLIHAGGPPAAVYLLARGLSKESYQATTVLVFAGLNAVKFCAYAALGLFTVEIAATVAAMAPVAIAGTLLGVWVHRRVSARMFFAFAYTMLAVAGAKLIHAGLAGG